MASTSIVEATNSSEAVEAAGSLEIHDEADSSLEAVAASAGSSWLWRKWIQSRRFWKISMLILPWVWRGDRGPPRRPRLRRVAWCCLGQNVKKLAILVVAQKMSNNNNNKEDCCCSPLLVVIWFWFTEIPPILATKPSEVYRTLGKTILAFATWRFGIFFCRFLYVFCCCCWRWLANWLGALKELLLAPLRNRSFYCISAQRLPQILKELTAESSTLCTIPQLAPPSYCFVQNKVWPELPDGVDE